MFVFLKMNILINVINLFKESLQSFRRSIVTHKTTNESVTDNDDISGKKMK